MPIRRSFVLVRSVSLYLHFLVLLSAYNTAAFCFYNLSSIVNGLVYYDQFALIPPLHLGLVILGIVVLLAGVWIVSVNSESGDPESDSERSSLKDGDESDGESDAGWESDHDVDEPSSMTQDEQNRVSLAYSPPPNPKRPLRSPTSPTSSRPHLTSPTVSSTSSPTLHQRRLSGHTRHSSLHFSPVGFHQHGQSQGSPIDHHDPHHSARMSPSLPSFAIGLSPVSPGFAIRGRRVSLGGAGGGAGSGGAGLGAARGVSARRHRGASESGVGVGEEEGTREESEPLLGSSSREEGTDVRRERAGKWGWLKGRFGRT